MAIINIVAQIECDSCGSQFTAELDPADKLPGGGWTLWDWVEAEVMAGDVEYEGRLAPAKVLEGGRMICPGCAEESGSCA